MRRVGHRTPFPIAGNGHTFAGNAAEECVLVAVYADLLRAHDWTVSDPTTNRPRLLVSEPSAR
ncbi:hypothetical protein [Streptomyces sp. bgisy153]|uniref:hypothetical protein n=1 Tax=Streptomyces sp. bgisy153 TaxID=3413793 RepID=UPI003D735C19